MMPPIPPIRSSEITPESVYLNRRQVLASLGLAAGGAALAGCGLRPDPSGTPSPPGMDAPSGAGPAGATSLPAPTAGALTDELGDPLTSWDAVTGYNNYYEFTTQKEGVKELAEDFVAEPWKVTVSGMVSSPRTYDLDDLRAFQQEERIYRLRCVEAWSMVIPWEGFPLRRLLEEVEPTSEAKFVRFETVFRPEQMPGQKRGGFPWPYVEGLRLDEAMNDLAILATGVYGRPLPAQNGAPVRLVVPWKYGFKSIKSIVRISLVDEMPVSLWMDSAPREYGFFANVNPNVDHPRWSQATERRIEGGIGRRETLMFNGYADQVAHLYDGMDLETWF